jgi:hypothetical protein
MSKLKTTTTPKTKFKNELVLKLEQQIQVTKLQKEQLPNSDWDNDTKFKMDIFYQGKITAYEMVINDLLNQIK